jgi:hypothetical protein
LRQNFSAEMGISGNFWLPKPHLGAGPMKAMGVYATMPDLHVALSVLIK